jgi:hypothetical protein
MKPIACTTRTRSGSGSRGGRGSVRWTDPLCTQSPGGGAPRPPWPQARAARLAFAAVRTQSRNACAPGSAPLAWQKRPGAVRERTFGFPPSWSPFLACPRALAASRTHSLNWGDPGSSAGAACLQKYPGAPGHGRCVHSLPREPEPPPGRQWRPTRRSTCEASSRCSSLDVGEATPGCCARRFRGDGTLRRCGRSALTTVSAAARQRGTARWS